MKVVYIENKYEYLTKGKVYQLLKNKDCKYYYIMDDNNEFIGIHKTDYFGGHELFKDFTKYINRNIKINYLLNG